MKIKAFHALQAEVWALTKIDDPGNYECADDACESILSEIEADRDVTAAEADSINGIVTDWYFENE